MKLRMEKSKLVNTEARERCVSRGGAEVWARGALARGTSLVSGRISFVGLLGFRQLASVQ